MNDTLINLLQQIRAKTISGKRRRGKKIPSGLVDSEEVPQEEKQPGPWRQYNNFARSLNHKSSDEEDVDTTCTICKIPWIEMMNKCGDWVQWDMCDEYI